MNINYDIVVVGAGNAGLVAALKASKEGKKVLLIDNNNIPGGIATSTLKGRFEFENSLHKLTGIMTDDNKGVIRKIFDEFEISNKIEWIKLTEGYKIIILDSIKDEYIIQIGVDDFIKKSSIISYSREALERIHTDIEQFAECEKLTAHANSIKVRFED